METQTRQAAQQGHTTRRVGNGRAGPKTRRQRGFTLMEIMGTLLIIALATATVMNVVDGAQDASASTRVISETSMIRQAASLYAAPGDFTGMTMALLNTGDRIGNGSGSNPWGGNYTVTVAADGATYTLTLTLVPAEIWSPLQDALDVGASTAAALAGTTVTVSYDR